MKKYLLLIIIILAFAFRFYKLGNFPAFNADEAALGYNAYSLIQTGADEHGNPWPVHFQSFNDYKPGFYVYLIIPFVKLLGLNEWAVRIPGALLGVGTVISIYFLSLKLTNKKSFALSAAFLLSINPWHIHFSRGGWEVNVATFFITTGLVFLFIFLEKKHISDLFVSVFLFVASVYTYHSARIIAPLLILGLISLEGNNVFQHYKKFVLAAVLGVVLCIPLLLDLTGPAIISRAAGVGLLADPGPLSRINEQRGEHTNYSSIIPKLLHNKPVNYSLALLSNWGEHYWGEFLFLSGDDIQRNKVPETGQLYLFEIITVLIGLIVCVRDIKRFKLIIFWLIISPLGAALTFQSPHALRAHNMIIPLSIVSAVGLATVFEYVLKTKKQNSMLYFSLITLFLGIIFWSNFRYIHQYYLHMPKAYPYSSQYGVKELVSYLKEYPDQDKKVIVTDRYDQPYILFLFYLKYPPKLFQSEHTLGGRDQYGFSTVREFSKYKFESIKYDEARTAYPNTLLVGTDGEIPNEANIIKNIYGINNFLYFQIFEN